MCGQTSRLPHFLDNRHTDGGVSLTQRYKLYIAGLSMTVCTKQSVLLLPQIGSIAVKNLILTLWHKSNQLRVYEARSPSLVTE
jgi:hypothetical protein